MWVRTMLALFAGSRLLFCANFQLPDAIMTMQTAWHCNAIKTESPSSSERTAVVEMCLHYVQGASFFLLRRRCLSLSLSLS